MCSEQLSEGLKDWPTQTLDRYHRCVLTLCFPSSSSTMAEAPELFSEQELTCSICLDLFSEPVSTPCGHNFCQVRP